MDQSEDLKNALIMLNGSTKHELHFKYPKTGHWMLIFNISSGTSNNSLAEIIGHYFSNFDRLDLKSQVYVLAVSEENGILFEVYKTHFRANLTITQLCKMNKNLNKIEYLNTDFVWARRKKLNGVTFKVGFTKESILVYDETKVNNFSFLSNFIYSRF